MKNNHAMEEKRHKKIMNRVFSDTRVKPKPLAWFKRYVILALSDCDGMCNLCQDDLKNKCLTIKNQHYEQKRPKNHQ